MNKINFLLIAIFSLALISCTSGRNTATEADGVDIGKEMKRIIPTPKAKKLIKNRCIPDTDTFAQGQDEELYGIDCIDGMHLLIETAKEGKRVATSHAVDGPRLEEELSFINKVYQLEYEILKNKGRDKKIAWLRDFLPENERFLGAPNKKYRIIFELHGNYLVLFKASENLNDLPYIERTTPITKSKDGRFYMLPFIGYPIEYCHSEAIRNAQGEETYESKKTCHAQRRYEVSLPDGSRISKSASYIYAPKAGKKEYKYISVAKKKDLLPSNYFDGQWFFSKGPIELPGSEGHLSPSESHLVKLKRKSNQIDIMDDSGDVEERHKISLSSIPVKWLEFEMAKDGDVFKSFEERVYDKGNFIERPYLRVDFPEIKMGAIKVDVEDVLVTKDYFSYVLVVPSQNGTIKYKVSLLRKDKVDTQGFVPRRLFKDTQEHVFGTMFTNPQKVSKEAEDRKKDVYDHYRMIRFNTSLNTKKEKKTKTKVIKWHYSKNSTSDTEIRAIAEKAVKIWDRAFEIITEKSDTKIKVVLDEKEDKDLGDLRYNIINMVKTTDVGGGSGLLGYAPSYVNPNTGQIIGTTANVFAHKTLDSYYTDLRNYIRYEIFHRDKKTHEENETHVVSPFVRTKIQNYCSDEVRTFIAQSKKSGVKPRDHLEDIDLVLSCGKKIAEEAILHLLLHEMGHSFGLSHNFRASTDSENYYQSMEEIKNYFPSADHYAKQPAKSSSVMDYTPLNTPQLQSLGKYDLEVLRFLYLAQVKAKDGQILTLNIPENPEEQEELGDDILSQKKPYLHCSDKLASSMEDILCLRFDYGSNPLEIVEHDMARIKRVINLRYGYDSVNINPFHFLNVLPVATNRIVGLYYKWLAVRNEYLASQNELDRTKYKMNDEKSIEKYQSAVEAGLESDYSQEYKLFYPLREAVPEFLMDNFLFVNTMRCRVKDNDSGQLHSLNLEAIKQRLKHSHGEDLYVEDCYSSQISDFFTENNLTFIAQTGMEEFQTYYSKGKKSDNKDVVPLFIWMSAWNGYSVVSGDSFHERWTAFTNEPDFFEMFKQRLQTTLLEKGGTGNSGFDYQKMSLLYASDLVHNLSRTLGQNPEDQVLLRKNIENLLVVPLTNGTGGQSFYKRVIEPTQNGLAFEQIGIPFLVSAYESYREIGNSGLRGFHDYLRKMPATIDDKSSDRIVIPFHKGSFVSKMIEKYNENLKELDQLKWQEGQQKLFVIEEMKRDSLEGHNKALLAAILKVQLAN